MNAPSNSVEIELPALNGLAKDLADLFNNVRHGHMGAALYTNGGSALFTRVVQTQGYTPYVGELGLIKSHVSEIADWAKDIENVVIVGSGPALAVLAKEATILKELPNLKNIQIIERSPDFAQAGKDALQKEFHGVSVKAYQEDFLNHTPNKNSMPALVISTGSLTNFENAAFENFPGRQLTASLVAFKNLAGNGGKIIWGYDSKLDDKAYKTKEISDFLLYPLNKAAQLPQISIQPDNYLYEPKLYPQASHLAHQWVAQAFDRVVIDDEVIHINRGDRFTMFSSIKPDPHKVSGLAKEHGMDTSYVFDEPNGAIIHCFDCK